jgi:3-oxoacyl-[acyl-carrier-protein] synthase-3
MDFPSIHIVSVGTELPGPAVDNATLASRFNMPPMSEQWIDAFIGTRTRHFSMDLDSGEVRHSLADLGEMAARRAMTAGGLQAADIDLMVMGTASPDMLMPATINQIGDRLGINNVPTFQLQSGCSGAVQALDVAHQMLQTGRYETALVLGADSTAKHFNLAIDVSAMSSGEQVNGVMFGDGAGAAILSTRPAPGSVAIRRVYHRLVGLGRAPGHIIEWFGSGDRLSDRPGTIEDYKAIEESVPVMAVEILEHLLDEQGWKREDLDFLLPPQLSGTMTNRIVQKLAVTGATEVSCVVDTGNTGNALPFFQLELLLPQMCVGNRAMAIAVESSKWIKAGFVLEKV